MNSYERNDKRSAGENFVNWISEEGVVIRGPIYEKTDREIVQEIPYWHYIIIFLTE